MCLLFFALDVHPQYPLVLAANRDEFYDRPSAAAAYWEDHPDIFAGRDLRAGGTWLGVSRSGRFAAVTNYRDPSALAGTRSRGELVADFLRSGDTAADYIASVEQRSREYSGFNLLVGEFGTRRDMFYYSNRVDGVRALTAGIYGLSNHLLDTPWPKVDRGRKRFAELIAASASKHEFFDLLADRTRAEDHLLPSTGITLDAERALSSVFIETIGYGTRSSAFVRVDRNGRWEFDEKLFV